MTPDLPALHGRPGRDVVRRIGSMDQLAGVDRLVEEEGAARGARRIRLVTGGGLEAEIHPDRALDLGRVTYRGVPVAWLSPTGMASPALASSHGRDWLRSFGGGLLATCGLDTFGPATTDLGDEYPMHGRVGVVPGTVTRSGVVGEELIVAGTVRQTRVFGENLVLERTWSADLGGTVLRLHDVVRNEGLDAEGHMILYHVNVGWPLLDERATLDIGSVGVRARDDDARAGVNSWRRIEAPQAGYREQVFGHRFREGGTGVASVDNPVVDTRFELRFDTNTLPALHQWKMCGEGHYALGLEPVNVDSFTGRAGARAAGILPILERGGSACYKLEFRFGRSASRSELLGG